MPGWRSLSAPWAFSLHISQSVTSFAMLEQTRTLLVSADSFDSRNPHGLPIRLYMTCYSEFSGCICTILGVHNGRRTREVRPHNLHIQAVCQFAVAQKNWRVFSGDRAATRQGDILNRFPRCFHQGIQQEYAWMPKRYLTYAEKWQHEQT